MREVGCRAWPALLLASGILLLSACSIAPTRTAPIEERKQHTPPVVPRTVPVPRSVTAPAPPPATQVYALPDTAVAPRALLPAPIAPLADTSASVLPVDPVLGELLAQVERASARGDQGTARATLERALKIKPEDARLWLRLAELNFDDGEFEQASVMAQRARALAHGERQLLERSDDLLARARQHLNR